MKKSDRIKQVVNAIGADHFGAFIHHENRSKYSDENDVKAKVKGLLLALNAELLSSGANFGVGNNHKADQIWLLPNGAVLAVESKWCTIDRSFPTPGQTAHLRAVNKRNGYGVIADRNNIQFLSLLLQNLKRHKKQNTLVWRMFTVETFATELPEVTWDG